MPEEKITFIRCMKCDFRRLQGGSDDVCPVCNYDQLQVPEKLTAAQYQILLDEFTKSLSV